MEEKEEEEEKGKEEGDGDKEEGKEVKKKKTEIKPSAPSSSDSQNPLWGLMSTEWYVIIKMLRPILDAQ